MATLKEQLASLSNQELEALKQELIKAQATGGNIAGMENKSSSGRGILPPATTLGGRIGKGILSGAQAAGESVVRDIRSMAGFKPPEAIEWKPKTQEEALEFERAKSAGQVEEFLAKKKLENQLEIEKINQLIGDSGQTESGGSRFRVKGVDVGGMNLERIPTEEEKQQEIQQKVAEARALEEGKGLSAESAGKLAMVSQAETDLRDAEALLFPGGKFAPSMAFQTNFPGGGVAGTEGRQIYSKILNAVNAKLRIETGAQANPSEVKNILERFLPTMRDTDETAKDKFRRLKEFMSTTKAIIDPRGRFIEKSQTQDNDPLGIR